MNISDAVLSDATGPVKFGIHSVEGFGKTTILSNFPRVLVMGPPRGIPRDLGFAVKVVTPDTWDDVLDVTESLAKPGHGIESFAVDEINNVIEPLIHRYLCKRDSGRKTEANAKGNELISIEDYAFGKGFLMAEEEFRKWISMLDYVQSKSGVHIAMSSHSTTRTFKNPSGPDYDRYEPKCHVRISAVFKEWVENLFFGFFEVDVSKEKADLERANRSPERVRAKGSGGNTRLLGCQQSALYDAKNRLGLGSVIELPSRSEELIPYILGDHIGASPEPRDVPAEPAPKKTERKSQDDREGVTDQRRARGGTPKDEPKPAHHEDRKDDEKRRQDDAYENARKNTADAERIAAEKRDAREWTEPKKPEPARDERRETQHDASPSNKKAPRDEQAARIEKLNAVVERAGKEKDAKYKAKVEKWIAGAKGDPDKIDAIIEDVENTLKAA